MIVKLRHGQTAEFFPDGSAEIRGCCIVTKQPVVVRCSSSGLRAWMEGAYIQNALKELSVEDREFLISGLSKEGFDEAFGDED